MLNGGNRGWSVQRNSFLHTPYPNGTSERAARVCVCESPSARASAPQVCLEGEALFVCVDPSASGGDLGARELQRAGGREDREVRE